MIWRREYKLRGSTSAGLEVEDTIPDSQCYFGRDVLSGCSQLCQGYGVCLDARRTMNVHEELIDPRFVYNNTC
jgi:hypothetical protein